MWLLKLHIAISVLCLLTYLGFRTACAEQIKSNGYTLCARGLIEKSLMCFVPFFRIVNLFVLFVFITNKKDNVEAWANNLPTKKEFYDKRRRKK